MFLTVKFFAPKNVLRNSLPQHCFFFFLTFFLWSISMNLLPVDDSGGAQGELDTTQASPAHHKHPPAHRNVLLWSGSDRLMSTPWGAGGYP